MNFGSKVQNKKFRVVQMQKYRGIGSIYQTSGCKASPWCLSLCSYVFGESCLKICIISYYYKWVKDIWCLRTKVWT